MDIYIYIATNTISNSKMIFRYFFYNLKNTI